MTITDDVFNEKITIKTNIGYKLYIPNQYESSESWPLILFLHGIKKRGNDINQLDNYGLIRHAEASGDFPFFVLAPQCPSLSSWPVVRHEIIALLKQIMSEYSINKKQVYVTGFSMGGIGVWDLATWTSDIFAAAVPIAGRYEREAAQLIDIPVWAFHGEEDDIVPIAGSIDMVTALQEAGKEINFTRYPGMKHEQEVMYMTYSNPELYSWLLSIQLQEITKL